MGITHRGSWSTTCQVWGEPQNRQDTERGGNRSKCLASISIPVEMTRPVSLQQSTRRAILTPESRERLDDINPPGRQRFPAHVRGEPVVVARYFSRMDDAHLARVESHIRAAYERIARQRRLIERMRKHQRHRSQMSIAEEFLGIMETLCKNYRVHRRLIQRSRRRS